MKKEMLEKLHSRNENKVIIGDINTGKTKNILLPLVELMISSEENLFIIDSKEEYYKKYSKKLKENGYKTILINLKDVNKSDCWNPLTYPKKLYKSGKTDQAIELIDKLGKVLFYEENTNSDPFWSNSASDFFSGIVLGLLEDAKENEVNLSSVCNIYNTGEEKFAAETYSKYYFSLKDKMSSSYISASGTAFAPTETRKSIISVAKQQLKVYVSREGLTNILTTTSFNFEKLACEKIAIFVITKDDSKTINGIATMFLHQLHELILQNKEKKKWNFILDNFDTLNNVNNLVDILSSAISNNINFYIATRSMDKLKENYGDYIKHIATLLVLDSNKITIEKNSSTEITEIIDQPNQDNLLSDVDITYPLTQKNEINIFDFKEFVKSKHIERAKSEINEMNKSPEKRNYEPIEPGNGTKKDTIDVDHLVSELDKKIKELEAEEKTISEIKE